jgi:hypothetical protein
MNNYHIYQIFLGLLLMMTLISGRALYYDQLDEGDKMKLSSSEDEGKTNERNFHQLFCCQF